MSISPTGAFSAQIPLDETGTACPTDMFDGRDVQIDIDVGAETVLRNATVNPVPYAHFASTAGTSIGAADGGALQTQLAGMERRLAALEGRTIQRSGSSTEPRQTVRINGTVLGDDRRALLLTAKALGQSIVISRTCIVNTRGPKVPIVNCTGFGGGASYQVGSITVQGFTPVEPGEPAPYVADPTMRGVEIIFDGMIPIPAGMPWTWSYSLQWIDLP